MRLSGGGEHTDFQDGVLEVVVDASFPGSVRTLVARIVGDSSVFSAASGEEDRLRIWVLPAEAPMIEPRSTIRLGTGVPGDEWDFLRMEEVERHLERSLRNLVDFLREKHRATIHSRTVRVLNEIGRALSAETDQERMLDELLTRAMRLVGADGGSIYLVEGQSLRFAAALNDTTAFFRTRPSLPLDDQSLAGWVATHAEPLNLKDVRNLPEGVPYRPNLRFDAISGYVTRSMLLVPLTTRPGRVLGVLALVNRKPYAGPITDFSTVTSFGPSEVALVQSIASQASVALEGYSLYDSIRRLFDGFVDASVRAIEARDPTTGGHSLRVAEIARLLAQAVHDSDEADLLEMRFSPQQFTELSYAALLHDFGKVGVREEILQKAARLHTGELTATALRFRMVAMQLEQDRKAGVPGATAALQQLWDDWELVQRLNRPEVIATSEEVLRLESLRKRWILRDRQEPVLSPQESLRLQGGLGSLNREERQEIERHVEHTYRFLRTIPWTENLSGVPELAYGHHERMDGSGYPRRLRGSDISPRVRILSIADIFDALTAGDRPYRRGLPPEEAVRILRAEAQEGRVHAPMVELLVNHRLWERSERWVGRATPR